MPDSKRLAEIFPQPAQSSVSLGFKLMSLDIGQMETRVAFEGRAEFTNPAGYIQGGYLSAMLDDTIGMLATVKTGGKAFPSTIDLHVQFLRPVRVGRIEVLARLMNIGRQVIFAQATLFDARGKEAARASASLAINPMKAPANIASELPTHSQIPTPEISSLTQGVPVDDEAYIYDAVRTPRGKGKTSGALHEITALSLGTQVLQAIRERNTLDTSLVDDVVLGCVSPVGEQGGDIARIAVLNADYAETTAGVQIDRFCASGLEACNMAASKVMTGEADMAIGGGVESMSRVPMGAAGGAWSSDPTIAIKSYFSPQGIGADTIATKWGFSRDDVDAFAVESQKRAARAWSEGRFARSIVPVKDQMGGIQLNHDEHMRPDATMQSLAGLEPSFAKMGEAGFDEVIKQRYPEIEKLNHVHHAGNSSGIVDGAAAVLFGSKASGERTGLKPRARVRAMASIGSEPGIMLTGPTAVTQKALKKAGMSVADIDLYELNEAFASVVLLMMHKLGIPHDKMNVNGGAIAFGHPLGATGAMLLGTVVDELERTGKGTALVTLCVGAGMGTATIIERI